MRAYRVAYDGRPYSGFQRQPDVPTVEGALLAGLARLSVCERDAIPEGYAAAGRTDAGVSAVAQTVAFEAPDWLTPSAFNSELPADVCAWASADVPEDFHATHEARERRYTYFLHAPEADDDLATETLEALCGRHDYHNLTPDDDGTVRELRGRVERDGDTLVVRFRAGGFARQLVRRVVGLLDEILRGESSRSKVERVFAAKPLPGPEGVAPAPAYPLVLSGVDYPDVLFETDDEAVETARSVFEDLHVERQTAARVAGCVVSGLE
ncbi:tRNA pseudouridine(38-40) synthase TruA [Haloarcula salinisoli]|uniref:tRNA pseudouridine synthase A n=1 Tax=Haloarcula salinisoli TaxID=2487746 RepID=A0A8J8CBP8_9EURY|nr:tRNA pseudouridine(38-40) synthase TruA [Halomicroarcula salinisoli]MBX0287754.1 tRNA pseudouridine(38-40) synthase TruA [Halomicroarcula salinisoli]MBX0304678.1 tRNA pseudouridine(38-40) synthase TruA [Halomicroarcula salinisoli]